MPNDPVAVDYIAWSMIVTSINIPMKFYNRLG